MKKVTDNSGRSKKRVSRRVCYMAYTLNNTQPVLCTLVSDQPYFYMEDESPLEDDMLDTEEFAAVEHELASLKHKIDIYEQMARRYERAPDHQLEKFVEQASVICGAAPAEKHAAGFAVRIEAILRESRMAAALLDCAQSHGVSLIENDQVFGARFDRVSATIALHPSLSDTETCLLAVRELRRHWQYRRGAGLHPLTFQPDQAILINRAQTADLSIAMIRVGWELQLAGQRDVWDHLETSSLADLARTFAREAFVDFRALANGKASAATFESWFMSERCRHEDKKLIQAMLADHQGYMFVSETAGRTVSAQLLDALGEQPYGKNYLATHAQMIVSDPMFTEVRDRSNANFLWFIKFERSFHETEQVLQEEGDKGFGVLPGSSSHMPDNFAERPSHGPESIVIPFFTKPDIASGRAVHSAGRRHGGGSNIIHAKFGNADAP